MKLFEEMIEKTISLEEEHEINKRYKKKIWLFYKAFALASNLINYSDNLIKKRNKLISRFILSKSETDSSHYKKLNKLITKDLNVINKAMQLIQKRKEESYDYEGYYLKGTVGMLAHEFPEKR